MKKTLAALIIGAFAASAANAAVIYDNEGTKVEVGGSLRLILEKTNQNGYYTYKDDQNVEHKAKIHSHTGLKNAGSRLEVKVKHTLDSGYYALGYLQVRLDGKQGKGAKDDGFGALGTKRAFVGLGHKERGELTFGRQVTTADSLSTANDYTYGIIEKDAYIPTEGDSVVRYAYKGIDNLVISADYLFANQRQNNEVVNDTLENGFQAGVAYEDGIIAKFGYGRTNYKSATSQKHHVDGFLATLGYDFGGVILSLDGGYAKEKVMNQNTKRFYVSPGFQYQVTDLTNVYGNYKYEQEKEHDGSKAKVHGFLLGVGHKLHKQVLTYVEGKYQVGKEYNANGSYVEGSKVKDKAIGVGIRVFF